MEGKKDVITIRLLFVCACVCVSMLGVKRIQEGSRPEDGNGKPYIEVWEAKKAKNVTTRLQGTTLLILMIHSFVMF